MAGLSKYLSDRQLNGSRDEKKLLSFSHQWERKTTKFVFVLVVFITSQHWSRAAVRQWRFDRLRNDRSAIYSAKFQLSNGSVCAIIASREVYNYVIQVILSWSTP